MVGQNELQKVRAEAALAVNADDADVWRWFSSLMDDHRIRWRDTDNKWLVSVDNRHVATEQSFDSAIRSAKDAVDLRDSPPFD
ncbi:hypothetical protein P350_37440 [Burkholderia cepacia JBK9]|uniref:hypothetical protein n=1 Tax=Burkholderia arboris TaxID=488730 RepID=UPI0004D38214|nr:hypothetical protein [Burkholderia arboris]ALX17268.1 hypothetical protein P350_37440 [Burkholderia cepacia JBK9]MCA8494926.1 hypothetical protein [Burkholderia arboris]